MSYPDEPTIHESINQFFTFIEKYPEFKNVTTFIEEVYEIAFGDDAINRDWHPDEVIKELESFSDKALKYDERED